MGIAAKLVLTGVLMVVVTVVFACGQEDWEAPSATVLAFGFNGGIIVAVAGLLIGIWGQ